MEIRMLQSDFFAAIAIFLTLAGTCQAQAPADTVKKGAQAYRVCAACHSLQPGVHLSGPSLAGRWGEKAATVSDYGRYTEALKKVAFAWDEITLDAWLAKPEAMVPGTTMLFRGIQNDATRGSLIAFLRLAMARGGAERAVADGLISKNLAAGQLPQDLTSLGSNQRIREIRHCRDAFHVTTADGAEFPFWETNVRLKIDTSRRGPKSGEPVLLRSGMAGDRVSVVFSSAAELARLVDEKC
jgi:cytochrome c